MLEINQTQNKLSHQSHKLDRGTVDTEDNNNKFLYSTRLVTRLI